MAFQPASLPIITLTKFGSEKSCPVFAANALRCSSQAGHSSMVCCAVSGLLPHWWHTGAGFIVIKYTTPHGTKNKLAPKFLPT
ncbi:hypothetical protein B5X24_HaOG215982 [Helicoverpa armigera]|nr:hypothetical protein B5X24_HaOG215982 [Helicoverpa armigera]